MPLSQSARNMESERPPVVYLPVSRCATIRRAARWIRLASATEAADLHRDRAVDRRGVRREDSDTRERVRITGQMLPRMC